MARANVLLVRWAQGWIDQQTTAVGRRRETMLSIGNVDRINDVQVISQKMLEVLSDTNESMTLTIEPRTDGTTPYIGWRPFPGARITAPGWTGTPTAQKVVGLSVAEDADGFVTFSPELISLQIDDETRLQRWLKRMSNGAGAGDFQQASPERPMTEKAAVARRSAATFARDTVAVGSSPSLPADARGDLREWYTSLTAPGSTATVSSLLVDGIVVATATIPAGELSASTKTHGIYITANTSRLQAYISQAGSGATGFVGQARVDSIAT